MSTTDDLVLKNYQPPKPSHAITHYVVKLFKSRLNSTTHVGFHCHCGHESKVQFPDYRAMTLLRIRTVPDNICDLVITAWRAHTKDLDGVHPHAEDQIRDFFSRQLEQPGGPTMTRYPLTAIPLDTPKPKSIAISTVVDENLRSIIGDYAKKLGIDVDPMGTAEWDVANGPDRPWYASANVATATAMREYLARLLYGDDGLVENLQADEANINEKLDEVVAELRREEAEQPISFPNEVSPPLAPNTAPLEAVEGFADKAHAKVCASTDRPTRIILRSYAADDKPRIERLLGLARQLQIPVQLAGSWSCTAFPKGEEAHPALDVVFPEVLVHPRDLLICEGDEKRLFVPSLTEAENQLLWAAREEDQRFITSLIELLGLHAEANREDIAAAVEQRSTVHPGWMECNAMDDRIRDILGAVYGEETDEAARRFVEGQEKVHAELGKQLEKERRETRNRVRVETARLKIEIANLKDHEDAWNCRLEKGDLRDTVSKLRNENAELNDALQKAKQENSEHVRTGWAVRDELNASQDESAVEAAKRVMKELDEWKRGQESWKNDATTQRQETAENQRKLLAILNAGTVDPSWQRCLDYAKARMKNAAQFESEVVDAMELPAGTVQGHVVQWAKVLVGQNKYQTGKLAEILGYKSDDYCELLQQVQRVIREHQTLLGERIESNAKIAQLYASLDRVVEERDGLSQRVVAVQKSLGDTEEEYDRSQIELAKAHTESDKLKATRSACGYCSTHLERVEKERETLKEQLNAIHVRMLDILGPNAGIAWPGIFDSVEKAVKAEADNKELEVKLSQANLTLERLRATLSATEKDRDDAKERIETAITAERQTIAQRIDLALTGNAVATHLDTMLRAVGNSRRDTKILQNLISQIADALDAPSEEKAFTNDDGSLNTALVNRLAGYYHRLYTAAGYSEPPQDGWSHLLMELTDRLRQQQKS